MAIAAGLLDRTDAVDRIMSATVSIAVRATVRVTVGENPIGVAVRRWSFPQASVFIAAPALVCGTNRRLAFDRLQTPTLESSPVHWSPM